jgi:hypothetical protein
MSGAEDGPSNVLKEVLPKVHVCLRGVATRHCTRKCALSAAA